MPLDHFIPQVHLKKFSWSDPPGRLNAIRKRDMFAFKPRAKDVCRVDHGSTNPYLKNPRGIETFLKSIEPNYTKAVDGLRSDKITTDCILVVSGFVAYVATCSPTAIRLETKPLASMLKEATHRLDAEGRFPPAPLSLGGRTMTDLLDDETVSVTVDHRYPQALGVSAIYKPLFSFGNFDWDVMVNAFHGELPFFTSDYPIGIVPSGGLPTLDKIIPLAPDIAIRLCPKTQSMDRKTPSDFSRFRYRRVSLSRDEVEAINRLIIRCAETEVYFRDDKPEVSDVVRSNAGFRIENVIKSIRMGESMALVSTQVVTDQ